MTMTDAMTSVRLLFTLAGLGINHFTSYLRNARQEATWVFENVFARLHSPLQ